MLIINRENLANLIFSDNKIKNMIIDVASKSIEFKLDGCTKIANGKVEHFDEGLFKINNFSDLKVTSYNAINDDIKTLNQTNYEYIIILNELEFDKGTIILKGQTKVINGSLNWIEYHVKDGDVYGEFKSEFPR